MKNLILLGSRLRSRGFSILFAPIKYLYYRCFNLRILTAGNTVIRGLRNIRTNGTLRIGLNNVGFTHPSDITLLNINGSLIFSHDYTISKGCRFDIGIGAEARFGRGYVNSGTRFIIMHGITVGDDCAISWDCQFLDDDFHTLSYDGRIDRGNSITIGDNVWIGSRVTILRGVNIPRGCIVAAGSIVSSVFTEEQCLIAGNPARIIRKNVSWE